MLVPRGGPAPVRTTVAIPRSLLIALSAGLGVTLLALAFLLGRQTAPPSTGVAVGPAVAPPGDTPAEVESLPAEASQADTAPAPKAGTQSPPVEPTPSVSAADTSPRAGAAPAPADPNLRVAVTRYFAELDAIEAVAKTWSDPQQLAMEIVQQAATGNSQGFDKLLGTQRQARDRLRTMDVPAVCREHHALVEALMDEALVLLNRVKQAAASGNLEALQACEASAHELEAKAKGLETLATKLKQRYGTAG